MFQNQIGLKYFVTFKIWLESNSLKEKTPARLERSLALHYATATKVAGLEALFALDDALAAIVRTTREPLVGQMRLTWWFHALTALDTAPPPAEPVLRALYEDVLPLGVSGATLAAMTDGWEVLIGEGPLDVAALTDFGRTRGGGLFGAAATLLGVDDPRVADAGAGWALADLAAGLSDAAATGDARALATAALDRALKGRWPRAARPLGALALLGRFDLAADLPPGHPRRVARILGHRLTGF